VYVPEEEKAVVARQLDALKAQAVALEERLRSLESGE
jgi:ubiquinone biosynthesis protein UbiJ